MLVQLNSTSSRAEKETQSYLLSRTPLLDKTYSSMYKDAQPFFAHIYVENRCHLKCKHCYEDEMSHPPQYSVSLDSYRRIFTELAELGVMVLTFSGGEPFVRKDFMQIVELARELRFVVRIYTSGTMINEKLADRLQELGVSEVHVSVYSHIPEKHDDFTGMKGSQFKSTRALQFLKDRNISTVLKSNVMTFNVDEMLELRDLARSLGADYAFDPTIKPKMSGDRSPLIFAVPPEELKEKFYLHPELHQKISTEEANRLCSGENPREAGNSSLCAAGYGLITIWADGSVAPCAMFPIAAGHTDDAPIEDIWRRSELFNSIRETKFNDMKSCSSCSVKQGCSPCMAYALIENDDMLECNSYSKQDATGKKLHALKTLGHN